MHSGGFLVLFFYIMKKYLHLFHGHFYTFAVVKNH